ncbi:hypothetical protein HDU90_004936 [Geranomyces variabilis]|nr:hypothetical protein HDU90_004936 [Geranomyces variabilis]
MSSRRPSALVRIDELHAQHNHASLEVTIASPRPATKYSVLTRHTVSAATTLVVRRETGLAALDADATPIANRAASGPLAMTTEMFSDAAPAITTARRAEVQIGGGHGPARRGIRRVPAVADAGVHDASRRRRDKKRKSDKRKRDKSKSKKKEKKEKREKKKKRKDSKSATAQYGAYGVIAASDMFRMQAEFWTWLVEVKKTSPESLPNYKMKEVFLDFMEAYNTASLPSKKYYNLDKWERDQLVRQQAEAGEDASMPEFDITKDEEMLKRHSKSLRMGKLPELNYSQDQLNELKKVSDDRVAADRLRKMGYQPKDSMGVRYERD